MQIGELAAHTGLTVDAIRFYERRGLIEKPHRTTGGFRIYGETDLEHLAFVQASQRLGFSLGEISELLRMRRAGGHACAQVRARLESKIEMVQAKIRELARLERDLRLSLARCNRQLRKKTPPAGRCPILMGRCSRKVRED